MSVFLLQHQNSIRIYYANQVGRCQYFQSITVYTNDYTLVINVNMQQQLNRWRKKKLKRKLI